MQMPGSHMICLLVLLCSAYGSIPKDDRHDHDSIQHENDGAETSTHHNDHADHHHEDNHHEHGLDSIEGSSHDDHDNHTPGHDHGDHTNESHHEIREEHTPDSLGHSGHDLKDDHHGHDHDHHDVHSDDHHDDDHHDDHHDQHDQHDLHHGHNDHHGHDDHHDQHDAHSEHNDHDDHTGHGHQGDHDDHGDHDDQAGHGDHDGLAGHDHAGHDHDHQAHGLWEHAGIYDLKADEDYTWSAVRGVDGQYAAKEMKLMVISKDAATDMAALEETAEAEWEKAIWHRVNSGHMFQLPHAGAVAAYVLEFDNQSWASLFSVRAPESVSYAFFAEHSPHEFANGFHYFKDQHGFDVMPTETGDDDTASTKHEDSLMVYKGISAAMFTLVTILSALLLRKVSKLNPKWLELCNACAGGVLIVVGVIHMMHENVGLLAPWGKDIAKAIVGSHEGSVDVHDAPAGGHDAHEGHDHRRLRGFHSATVRRLGQGCDHGDEFALGYFLFVAGFFLITLVDKCLGHGHDHGHHHAHDIESHEERTPMSHSNGAAAEVTGVNKPGHPSPTNNVSITHVVGFNALVGISIHSIIEAFAIGTVSGKSGTTFMFLTCSVAFHKFFEIPAIFSSFLGVLSKLTWWACVVVFALVTPVGLLMGMLTAANVESEVSAFLQCFSAGTLVAVGINHMLMPAIAEGTQWRVGKVVAAFLTASFLAVLPVIVQ